MREPHDFYTRSDSSIHETCTIYGVTVIGKNCTILEDVVLGYPSDKILREASAHNLRIEDYTFSGVRIGDNATIRPRSTIYCDVVIGNDLRTGHNVLVREMTIVGDDVLIGTSVIIEGKVVIGNKVSIQSNAYVPTHAVIEDNVFIGPGAVLTNDKYPIRGKNNLRGPVFRTGASIGANSTILPVIEIGEGAMVAAGAVVTKDVPAWKLARGVPAKIIDLPEELREYNRI